MLGRPVGRETELAIVASLVREARGGRGGALALVGPAGIGKSTLLSSAVMDLDDADRSSIVTLVGVEAERDVPFAGLSALVAPLGEHLAALTAAQHRALSVALGEVDGPAPGRMVLGGAVLSLLSAHAAEVPLLVLVDDLQWVDRPSAELVMFAARRLQQERAAVLVASRPPEPEDDRGLGDLLRSVPTLELQGLSTSAVEELLPDTAPQVAAALIENTGGNPLAMLEAAELLEPDARTGRRPIPRVLPATSAADSYRLRLSALSPAGRTAARVLGLAGSAPGDVIARAMSQLDVGLRDLEPIERTGLLTMVGGRPAWRHPLVRAAAAEGTAAESRSTHSALAASWAEVPDSQPQWAWHVAQAVHGTDQAVADALAAAAEISERRDASLEAADAWERAAQLSEDHDQRRQWMARAARAAFRGGATSRAADLYDVALSDGSSPRGRDAARWMHERGRIEHALGRPARAYELLLGAAEGWPSGHSVWALAEAVFAAMYGRRPDLARRAASLAVSVHDPADAVQRFLALHADGAAAALEGQQERGRELLEDALELILTTTLLDDEPGLLLWAVNADLFLDGMPPPLHRVIADAVRRLRESGELEWSPRVVRLVGVRDYVRGSWQRAYTAFEDALELSRLAGQRTQVAEALLCLAVVEAARGEREQCLAHCDEAHDIVSELEVAWLAGSVWHVRGLLHLTLGAPETATHCLRRAAEAEPRAVVDLAESLMLSGQRDEAERVALLAADPDAETSEVARALLGADEESARKLSEAAAEASTPFDAARLRLSAGAQLRRSGARRAAREELSIAAEAFAALGTPLWLERAEDELRATGKTMRRHPRGEELTPSEERVVALVAEGRANKEVAAALFLSPKTVEFHLSRAYRKLGVTNRTALSARLAQRDLA